MLSRKAQLSVKSVCGSLPQSETFLHKIINQAEMYEPCRIMQVSGRPLCKSFGRHSEIELTFWWLCSTNAFLSKATQLRQRCRYVVVLRRGVPRWCEYCGRHADSRRVKPSIYWSNTNFTIILLRNLRTTQRLAWVR